MSQILKDLNKLAAKMGAPVVGRNISEQVRAISTYYEGTSHGANIAERINEVAHSNIGGGPTPEPPTLIEKSVNQNGIYLASADEADGYSKVSVNVQPTLITKNVTANGTYNAADDNVDGYSNVIVNAKTKWLMSHGTEYIRIPKEDLAFTDKPRLAIKYKALDQESGTYPIIGGTKPGYYFYIEAVRTYNSMRDQAYYGQNAWYINGPNPDFTIYCKFGYYLPYRIARFNLSDEQIHYGSYQGSGATNSEVALHDLLVYSAMSYTDETLLGKSKAKIAYVHLYDNDTLIFSGTPAINPTTGKACLYDSVNDKYYGNANESSPTDFEIVEED